MFFFSFGKVGVPSTREGFIRHTDAQNVCAHRHTLVQKTFFWAVTLYVSCCYGDARL